MFDQVILGVDPGTAAVGIAAVASRSARPTVLWSTTLRTPSGLDGAERLRRIHDGVRSAIVEHRPSALAIERLLFGRNTGSAMDVARSAGVAMLAAAQLGIPVEEYAPLEVKMAMTGVGNAPKGQVRRALAMLVGADGVPSEPDAADAVAVAVCHIQQSGLRRFTRTSSSVTRAATR